MKRRMWSKWCVVTIAALLMPLNLWADGLSGTIPGTSLEWQIDQSASTLTITGEGDIPDYEYTAFLGSQPWAGITFKTLIIDAKVGKIGANAFANNRYLETVQYDDYEANLEEIGERAFWNCTRLYYFPAVGWVNANARLRKLGNSAFENTGLKKIELPSSVVYFGKRVFANCTRLETFDDSSNSKCRWANCDGFFDGDSCLTTVKSEIVAADTLAPRLFRGCSSLSFTSTSNKKGGLRMECKTIGDECFSGCAKIDELIFIYAEEIGAKAFYGCFFLCPKFGNRLRSIGEYAFAGCSFIHKMPFDITTIPRGAFQDTGIDTLILSKYVTTIGNDAFADCDNLKVVKLGSNITKIGDGAFFGSTYINNVTIEAETPPVISATTWDPVVLTKATLTAPEIYKKTRLWDQFYTSTVDYTCGDALRWYISDEGTLYIKPMKWVFLDQYPMRDYTDDKPAPWSGMLFWDVYIDDRVKHIGANAFKNMSGVKNVHLPESLTSIGESAFDGCTQMTLTGDLPEGLTSIGTRAFAETSKVKKATLPEGCEIGEAAFRNSGLTQLTLPEGMLEIPEYAFGSTRITSLTLPASVERIGSAAFIACTALDHLDLSDNDNLTDINDDAFSNCTGLKWIRMRGTILGDRAFAGCTAIEKFYHEATTAENMVGEGLFSLNLKTTAVLYSDLEDDPFASYFREKKSLTKSQSPGPGLSWTVTKEGNNTILTITNRRDEPVEMYDYDDAADTPWGLLDITSLVVNGNITHIGNNIMKNKTSLTYVNLSNAEGLVTIGDYAFSGSLVKTVKLPASLTTIGEGAFNNCPYLESIDLVKTQVASIGIGAFYDCRSLTSISLPATLTYIGASAFRMSSGQASKIAHVYAYMATCPEYVQSAPPFPDLTSQATFYTDYPTEMTPLSRYFKTVNPLSSANACGPLMTWEYEASTHTLIISSTAEEPLSTYDYAADDVKPWASYIPNIYHAKVVGTVSRLGDRLLSGLSFLVSVDLSEANELVEIGEYALSNNILMTTVNFSPDITTIGNYAFDGCTKLDEVTLPSSLQSIGTMAFRGCKLGTVKFPLHYTAIDRWAFAETKMTQLQLPRQITSIGEYAFQGCTELKSFVTVGSSQLKSIGSSAFAGDTKLSEVILPDGLKEIQSYAFGDCGSLTEVELPDGLTVLEGGAFAGCRLTQAVIPTGITSVSTAFAGNPITEVQFHPGVQEVESYAFQGCTELTQITLPDSLNRLGEAAFQGCTRLYAVNIPDGVTEIGNSTFQGTAIKSITLPSQLTSIGQLAFYGCRNLSSINLPETLTSIGDNAFKNTDIRSIVIPKNVTFIGDEAFAGCYLDQIEVKAPEAPEMSQNTFDDYAYNNGWLFVPNKEQYQWSYYWNKFQNMRNMYESGCGKNVIYALIPNDKEGYTLRLSTVDNEPEADGTYIYTVADGEQNVGGLWNNAEVASKINQVEIDSKISYIGAYGLAYLTNVERLDIPEGTLLGLRALSGCFGLKEIYIPNPTSRQETSELVNEEVDEELDYVIDQQIMEQAVVYSSEPATLQNHDAWGRFYNHLPHVEGACGYLYSADECSDEDMQAGKAVLFTLHGNTLNLYSGVSPYGMMDLGLDELKMRDYSNQNSDYAPWYKYKDYITKVVLGAEGTQFHSVNKLGNYAFYGLTELEEADLNGVSRIGQMVFNGCVKLKKVNLGSFVERIDMWAFLSCLALEEIEFPASLTYIDQAAFMNCQSLKEVVLPEGLNNLRSQAFRNCTSLERVTLPASLTTLVGTSNQFNGCNNLRHIYTSSETPMAIYNVTFDVTDKKAIIVHVPYRCGAAYRAANYWSELTIADGTLALSETAPDIIPDNYLAGDVSYTRDGQDGEYLTFCLPFAVDLNENDCLDEVYTLHNLALYYQGTQTLRLFFKNLDKSEILPAGTPFIAHVKGNVSLTSAEAIDLSSAPEIHETNIVAYNWNEGNGGLTPENENIRLTLTGSYTTTTYSDVAAGTTINYISKNGSYKNLVDSGSLKPFRSMILQSTLNGVEVKNVITDFDFADDATPVDIIAEDVATDAIYTVDGRRVTRADKGIYIVNGKKMLVK